MSNERVRLYDKSSIDQLHWPKTTDGHYAKEFMQSFIKEKAVHYIENAETTLGVLTIDDLVLPICINDKEYENTYVCSPYTHYISYAKQELYLFENRLLRRGLSVILDALGVLLKGSKINKTIHVNNWLVSTNLYPKITSEQLEQIVITLRKEFPKHSIIFRSLNRTNHRELMTHFQRLNFKLIGSRQIYLVHPTKRKIKAKARWLLKRDYKLIEKNGYEVVSNDSLSEEDIPRILELYHSLYLEKYSMYNPQFNEAFIELALKRKILHIKALRKNGRIDAVLGYFCREGIMTTPLFGYDLEVPIEVGLYRMLSVILYHISLDNGHLLNESSGAAQFKRNRGAEAEMEYTAIYDRHLPFYRRMVWSFLKVVINRLGVPLIQKYKL